MDKLINIVGCAVLAIFVVGIAVRVIMDFLAEEFGIGEGK